MNRKRIDQAIFELDYYMKVAKASDLEAPGMMFALKTMRALKVIVMLFESTPDEQEEVKDVASTPT